MNEKEKLSKSVTDLLSDRKYNNVISKAFKAIKPSRKRVLILCVLIAAMLIPCYNIIYEVGTVLKVSSIIDLSTTIMIALFAITFMGYALFQALISRSALKQMLITDANKYSTFKTYNLFFLGINTLYLTIIIFNFIMKIILTNINSSKMHFLLYNVESNLVYLIMLLIYLFINLFALTEMKSFLYNLYQCFSLNVSAEAVEIIRDEKKED